MRKGLENVMELRTVKSGNYHYEENIKDSGTVEIFYHTTCIAGFDTDLGIGFADNRGFNTVSTNIAVGGARQWLTSNQYMVVDVEEFKSKTGAQCRVGYWY